MSFRGAGVLIVHKQLILLGLRKFNPFKYHWTVPGGKCNRGESSYRAAFRELREEVINTEQTKLKGIIAGKYKITIPFLFTFTVYIVKINHKIKLKIRQPDEFLVLRWFSMNVLPGSLHPGIMLLINAVKNKLYTEINKEVVLFNSYRYRENKV